MLPSQNQGSWSTQDRHACQCTRSQHRRRVTSLTVLPTRGSSRKVWPPPPFRLAGSRSTRVRERRLDIRRYQELARLDRDRRRWRSVHWCARCQLALGDLHVRLAEVVGARQLEARGAGNGVGLTGGLLDRRGKRLRLKCSRVFDAETDAQVGVGPGLDTGVEHLRDAPKVAHGHADTLAGVVASDLIGLLVRVDWLER